MSHWVPLVEYQREGISEVVKFGSVCWVHGEQVIHQYGSDIMCFGRSLMKPYQMKVFVEELKDALSPIQKALSLASHNAEIQHVEIAQSMLQEHDLLATPSCMPLMPNDDVTEPSKWNHPCSGKHAGILRGCKIKAWPATDYQSQTHPYHQAFKQAIQTVLGENWEPKVTAIDGCGLPTFSNTLSELGRLFSALVQNKNHDWIWESMVEHPLLIGGQNRLDSAILEACNGKVLAKEGADGLLGLAIEHPDYPHGLGIIIKMSHGWDGTATWFVAQKILAQLGFNIPPASAPEQQTALVSDHVIKGSLSNHSRSNANKGIVDISPMITPDMPVFPGDTPFSREILMDYPQGDHLALSSINTTVHLGSHSDAPYHYHPDGRTIEQQDLQRYLGPTHVIDVTHIQNGAITISDIENIRLVHSKVLFKSNSFPHEGPWQNEFAYLSSELIEYLSANGVMTVGIDTPSVDAATSKDLPCHHTIYQKDMTILEGLDLRNVASDKNYDLIALPLKIKGGDASPVRAVLQEKSGSQ